MRDRNHLESETDIKTPVLPTSPPSLPVLPQSTRCSLPPASVRSRSRRIPSTRCSLPPASVRSTPDRGACRLPGAPYLLLQFAQLPIAAHAVYPVLCLTVRLVDLVKLEHMCDLLLLALMLSLAREPRLHEPLHGLCGSPRLHEPLKINQNEDHDPRTL